MGLRNGLIAGSQIDDRGRPTHLLNPAGFRDWPLRGDPRIALLVLRVGLDAKPFRDVHSSLIQFAFTFAIVGAILVVIVTSVHLWPSAPRWFPMAMFMGMSFAYGPIFRRVWIRFRGRSIANLILAEGLCPSCGYNLHGVHTDSDACIVCPECGGAWRRERLQRTAPFTAPASGTFAFSRWERSRTHHWSACDDRNVVQSLQHASLRRPIKLARDNQDRLQRLRNARRSIARLSWTGHAMWAIVVCVIFITCTVVLIIVNNQLGTLLYASLLVLAPLGVLIGIGWRSHFGASRRGTVRGMLMHRLCPCCADDFGTAIPDADGCTTCPTCLAAWRLPPPAPPGPTTCPSPPQSLP